MHFVWTTYNAQSGKLDSKYPLLKTKIKEVNAVLFSDTYEHLLELIYIFVFHMYLNMYKSKGAVLLLLTPEEQRLAES